MSGATSERVGFLVLTPELINHYAPVLDALSYMDTLFDIVAHRSDVGCMPSGSQVGTRSWGRKIQSSPVNTDTPAWSPTTH